jgi:hypothetical protein
MLNKLTSSTILLSLLLLISCAKDPEKDSFLTDQQDEFELLGSSYQTADLDSNSPNLTAYGCSAVSSYLGDPANGGTLSGTDFGAISLDFSSRQVGMITDSCTDDGNGNYNPDNSPSSVNFLDASTYPSLALAGVSYLEMDMSAGGSGGPGAVMTWYLLYKKDGNNLLIHNNVYISVPGVAVITDKYFLDNDANAQSFATSTDYNGIGGNDNAILLIP